MSLWILGGSTFSGAADAVAAWAWRASWQAAVLAVVVAVLLKVLGRRLSPGWRFALWGLVLVRLAVPPVVAVSWRGKVSDVPPVKVAAVLKTQESARVPSSIAAPPSIVRAKVSSDHHQAAPMTKSAAPSAAPSVAGAPWDWGRVKNWLVWAWIGGVVLLAVRVIASSVRLGRAVGRTEVVGEGRVIALLEACCAEAGVRRAPGVRSLPAGGGPALVGFWRPVILLPPGVVDGMSDGELRLILLHELAHVRRRDVLVNWLGTLVAVVHWPNPAAWWVMARMRFERELACDEFVLHAGRDAAGGADRGAYARTIVRLAEALSVGGGGGEGAGGRVAVPVGVAGVAGVAGGVGGVGIIEGKTQLQRRLQMIARFDATGRRWPAAAVGLGILVGAVALSGATRAADKPADSNLTENKPTENKPTDPNLTDHNLTDKAVEKPAEQPPGAPQPGSPAATTPGKPGPLPGGESPALPGMPPGVRPAVGPAGNPGARPGVPGMAMPGGHEGRGMGVTPPAADPASARTAEKLKKPLKVEFQGQALSDVLEYVRDAAGVDILVQWAQVEAAGLDQAAPVTLKLREPTPADAVLSLTFRTLPVKLQFEIDKGVVVVGTAEEVAVATEVTRVYDVSDLVAAKADAPPGAYGGGGGGGGGFPGGPATVPDDVNPLIRLITATVQPGSWREAGGTSGSIAAFKGKLVVKGTEGVHKEVARLLEMLREEPAKKGK